MTPSEVEVVNQKEERNQTQRGVGGLALNYQNQKKKRKEGSPQPPDPPPFKTRKNTQLTFSPF